MKKIDKVNKDTFYIVFDNNDMPIHKGMLHNGQELVTGQNRVEQYANKESYEKELNKYK